MEETNFRCKTCGALLVELAQKSQNGLVECPYCHNTWTIPKKETSPAALSFLRMGEHDLDTGKFDDAFTAYKKAAELDENEPEAYFGMALASFKVQYLKDEVNNRMQPICHAATKEKFTEDKNYMRALLNATPEQRAEYEKKGKEIDYILAEFSRLEASGVDYDCFLCVKVKDDEKSLPDHIVRTADCDRANDIYYYLKDEGYKPFFSEREIKGREGTDYEALILYALYKSECMLIVCSDEEYLQTKWVKNEYMRFMAMLLNEEKERDALSFAFYGTPVEKLPSGKKVQGIDLSKPDAYSRIGNFVESHTPETKKRKQQAAEKLRAEEEARNRELAEMREKLKQMEQERANASANTGFSSEQLLTMMRQAEEEERKKQEAERKKREEEERKRREEEERLAAEHRAKVEVERKKREEEEAYLVQFQIQGDTLKKYFGIGGDVFIPDGVTAIGERAFASCGRLTGITLSDNVASIGKEAFYRSGLKSIRIPKGVTVIERRVFAECKMLANVDIQGAVTSIEDDAFAYCSGLRRIIVPNSLTLIGAGAFYGCGELSSIILPNGVTKIGEKAFYGCSGLTSIQLPNSVASIGRSAFEACGGLTSAILPNSVVSIEPYAFCGCGKLINAQIPEKVTSIGESAFYNCSELTGIIIPDGVNSIDQSAFQGCSSLTSIEIPDSVTSIGKFAFGDCGRLTNVTIPKRFKGIMSSGLKNIFGKDYKNIRFTFTE